MDRRKVLSLIGGSSIASLSGCNTVRGVVRSGPPYFEEVTIDGPDEVAVGEEFELTVSAKNTGGRTGDFTTTLTVGEGALAVDTSVSIEDVEITETGETTVGPIRVDRTGEYVFRITDYDARQTVRVTTREQTVGEAFTTRDGLSISIEDLVVSGPYTTSDDVFSPRDGNSFLFAEVEVSNDSSEERSIPSTAVFNLRSDGREIDTVDVALPRSTGRPYDDVSNTIPAGITRSGWIPFEVPRDATSVEIGWRNSGDTVDVVWRPERDLSGRLSSVPSFEVKQFIATQTVERYEPAPVSLTVTNSGSESGTFYGLVTAGGEDFFDDSNSREITVDVPGEGEATTDLEITHPDQLATAESFTVALSGMASAEESVEILIPTREVGKRYRTPTGLEIGVLDVQLVDTIKTESAWGDGFTEVSREADERFLALRVTSRNDSDIDLPLASASNFQPAGIESGITVPGVFESWGEEISGDVSGNQYVATGSFSPGTERTGWIVWTVPSDYQPSEIRWERGLNRTSSEKSDLAARWTV
ncbi:DUF4352 domain-containing protein [Halobaculum sp. EA56]|uniref:DUF4352 domain-containing protein n=1 Tax=Halobaculum sp. EA56 TaxID=3421648 RepID=UPI003EBF5B4E